MSSKNTTSLPINQIKTNLLEALQQHPTVLLTAPPGAGKSTCLPLWLLAQPQYFEQTIYMLQPRRIAAKNVATYLAKQLGENVGETVGYRLRNDSKVSNKTRFVVVTEGLLTQIIQQDPELVGCGLIIFDEFHERSLHADLAFALSRDTQLGLRDDLTLLLMSATLASDDIKANLPDAHSIACEGRTYPIEIEYQSPSSSREWRQHAIRVIQSACQTHIGSVLVFLPGVNDINIIAEALQARLPSQFVIAPMHGGLSLAEQQMAINKPDKGQCKVVLSTNIAETSLTIDGVNLVIDCGFEKVAVFDSNTLSNNLVQRQIAKDSAIQRAGRAGRLMPGKCIRLYASEDFSRRKEHSESEILHADIQTLLIEAARWGVKSLAELPMLELPPERYEQQVWQQLQQLNLIDEQHRLTQHGKQVSQLACHPRFAHMIIAAKQLKQSSAAKNEGFESLDVLACILAALLEERDIFARQTAHQQADISLRVNVLLQQSNNHHYKRILNQAVRLAKLAHIKPVNSTSWQSLVNTNHCGLLLALAYPERIAKLRNKSCEFIAANGKGLQVENDDPMSTSDYIVAAQLQQYQQQLRVSLGAEVNVHQLIAHKLVKVEKRHVLRLDELTDRIISAEQQTIGRIVIKQTTVDIANKTEQLVDLWCDHVTKKGLKTLNWQANDLALLERWRWLNQTQEHLGFPKADEQSLLLSLDVWFAPFISKVRKKGQLSKLDLSSMLLSLLTYQQQQQLNQYAPQYFIGPTKRKCPIRYSEEQAPVVSLPMQELYGVSETPSVGDKQNGSQVALILEILSPAKRPIQITQDLVAFWQGSYKAVQKDMKSQYPKHFWPDDPANAQATRKTKRHLDNKN